MIALNPLVFVSIIFLVMLLAAVMTSATVRSNERRRFWQELLHAKPHWERVSDFTDTWRRGYYGVQQALEEMSNIQLSGGTQYLYRLCYKTLDDHIDLYKTLVVVNHHFLFNRDEIRQQMEKIRSGRIGSPLSIHLLSKEPPSTLVGVEDIDTWKHEFSFDFGQVHFAFYERSHEVRPLLWVARHKDERLYVVCGVEELYSYQEIMLLNAANNRLPDADGWLKPQELADPT